MRIKIKKIIIFLTILITVLAVIFFVVMKNKTSADSSRQLVENEEYLLELGGKKIKLNMQSYKVDSRFEYYLFLKSGLIKTDSVKLDGFEDNISLCEKNIVHLGGDKNDAICFVGDVGAHSQNLVFVKLDGDRLKTVNFKQDDRWSSNINSDSPQIITRDVNGDGLIEVLVDNRNYDKDPITDLVRSYYKQIDDYFVFDKSEDIQYY